MYSVCVKPCTNKANRYTNSTSPPWSGARGACDIKRGANQTNEERPTNQPTRPQSTISSFYAAAATSRWLQQATTRPEYHIGEESPGGDCRLALHPFAFDKVIFTVLASRQQQGHPFLSLPDTPVKRLGRAPCLLDAIHISRDGSWG